MKTLLLLRHGRAQESAPGGDKARRLTEQGRLEATEMGRRLSRIAGGPDDVLSSDSARALDTARIAASGAGYSGEVRVEPDIYSADVDTLLDVVRGIDAGECVLLVGHNPGLEYLAAALAQEGTQEPSLPTGGLVHLTFEADRWRDVRPHTGRLLGVYRPGSDE